LLHFAARILIADQFVTRQRRHRSGRLIERSLLGAPSKQAASGDRRQV
jgi:hypothetical protein